MKVMTILGTRPEIIRLCRIIEKLDCLYDQVLVHTGQNYSEKLSDIFFEQLGVRPADYYMDAKGTFGEQIGRILSESERLMLQEKPDKFLVLGDTNSSLAAIMAKRLGVPVYHMEAGNRCFDDRVPEEVNRRIIDHCSDVLMPYTERSRQNLLREGIPSQRIFVTGNPIYEVIQYYDKQIKNSTILQQLDLEEKQYFLVTIHRAENVDLPDRFAEFISAFDILQKKYKYPVIVSTHPHTHARMKDFKITLNNELVRFIEPFGFFEFIKLERNAFCVLSDSGTVQEECSIFKVPNITIRDVTERPETIEWGNNILSGGKKTDIIECVKIAISRYQNGNTPTEYLVENVSDTVINILAGFFYK